MSFASNPGAVSFASNPGAVSFASNLGQAKGVQDLAYLTHPPVLAMQAESKLDSVAFGEHGAAQNELLDLRQHVLVSKLQSSQSNVAAAAREVSYEYGAKHSNPPPKKQKHVF